MAEGSAPLYMTEDEAPSSNHFAMQTRNIFKSFVYVRLTSLIHQEANTGSMDVGELSRSGIGGILQSSLDDQGSSDDQTIGKALASAGDQLYTKYHSRFVDMIKDLGLTSNTAYPTFAKVASRLFQNGITWGRIVALLLFGYEIAVSVIKKGAMGMKDFLLKIVNVVVEFIMKEKIAQWIEAQGGWLAFLDLRKNNIELWATRAAVVGVIALVTFFAINWMKPTRRS